MKTRQAVMAAIVTGIVITGAWVHGGPKPAEPRSFASVGMRIKLDFAKDLLAGLATADFKTIRENAEAMQGLNAIEEFARGNKPGYKDQLVVFRSATDELLRAANDENLDGATLAYTQMTASCVNCHKVLRR